MQRRKKRTEIRQKALAWPRTQAKLLEPKLTEKDELAEGRPTQDHQVEVPFYFSFNSGYFGGHVRTLPCSEGEARRIMKQIHDGSEITVRYNPANPDEVFVMQADNPGALVVGIWEG